MRIKSLQMQGFKSFGDKTELYFDRQVIGVVGPNGCGKSNIVDAIRWVMGEQSAKGLRGSEMADVIFNGTTERKKASFAEVSLTFENSDRSAPAPYQDCEEIMITRRLYRSGESEYLINKVNVRLKDINDLFLGTGSSARAYSIVAQGKVDQVVLAKPEDRRLLLEEAAGIAKYKVRRQAAERKIEATNTNLERVQDIISELERNARYLDRQVERAEKFRSLQTELRHLDEQIISARVTRLDRAAASNNDLLEKSTAELVAVETALRQTEAALEEFRLQALNSEKASASDYERLLALKETYSAADKRIELANQRIELLGNQIREREKDIERLRHKSEAQTQAVEAALLEREALELKKVEKQSELANLKTLVDQMQSSLDQTYARMNELQQAAEESRAAAVRRSEKMEFLKKERERLDQERSQILTTVESIKAELEKLSQVEIESISKRDRLLDTEISVSQRLESVREDLKSTSLLKSQTESRLRDFKEMIVKADAERESLLALEEHEVGYEPGVLDRKKRTGFPIILDLVKFDSVHDRIANAFLSKFGQVFVDAISADEDVHSGRISVLNSQAPKAHDHLDRRTLWDLLIGDKPSQLEGFLRSIQIVSHNTFDFNGPIQISEDGELYLPLPLAQSLTIRGLLKANQTPHGRREELEALAVRKNEFDAEASITRGQLASLEDKLKLLEIDQKNTLIELKQIQGEVGESKIAIVRLESKRDSLQKQIQQWAAKEADLVQKLSIVVTDFDELGQQTIQESSSDELNTLKAKVDELKISKEKIDSEWLEKRIEMGALEERLSRAVEQTIHAEMTHSEFAHNQSLFQADIEIWTKESQSELTLSEEQKTLRESALTQARELESGLASTRDQLNKLRSELDQFEVSRRQQGIDRDEKQKIVQALELERQQLKHEIEELSALVNERYHVSLQEILAGVSAADLEKLEDETILRSLEVDAKELREKVDNFGDVNLLAINEFEEINKRLQFMNTQKEDLLKTLDALQSIIDRINQITEFRFRETFKAINHNFQILFPKLFGGGRAFMSLTNENDLLETGVEIFAEPPGKKVQSMSLLSGGEKALTSISLLFALFAYRPASFCILDEVDAPLDEVNTTRYNNIIREMSALSQFIVITHNKKTMEVAEKLFGVTMQEPGVTQIVGVELQEARAFVATA